MNLMSCESCGVVLDREVLKKQLKALTWEQKMRWQGRNYVVCPVCKCTTTYPEEKED